MGVSLRLPIDDDFPFAAAGFRLPVALLDLLLTGTSTSESESETLPMTCLLFLIRALEDLVNFLAIQLKNRYVEALNNNLKIHK